VEDNFMRYLISTLLLSLAACTGSATYRGTATYDTPELVYAEPGVQVTVDSDDPVFYADNYYWRNDGGRWYRSNYYNRGWVYANPPQVVARIQSPARYRHYRPQGYTVRRHDDRGRTVIRDRRGGYYRR
jgi:hypothetical protein